ncbi:uncharacterized protein I206_105082 [Kwoniella pini CBS 10737]|uniref:Uncharacterized protein n=1 Tax=Kwoniella pini CBS 10737 TaxID=1296096 RepID=A0A1B9I8R2_9TREE|nr:uncharacterized protein I206_02622 [Kwoniella pini CBS 10737]OCF51906.1 hypothetical protein I206_02622 [Kwoniella pini CBS 10737]
MHPSVSDGIPNVEDGNSRIEKKVQDSLKSISTVLISYSTSSSPSTAYLESLISFYNRAISFTNQKSTAEIDSHNLIQPIRERRFSAPNLTSHLSCSDLKEIQVRPKDEIKREEKDIDKLAKDWWKSEIVAAWYGPNINPKLTRRVSGISNPVVKESFITRTVFPDEKRRYTTNDQQNQFEAFEKPRFEIASDHKTTQDWIVLQAGKDAGYVGLHDE